MDKNIEAIVKQMIYDKEREEVVKLLDKITDPEMLHLYAYNYNWDNGFEIPRIIIHKDCCQLSTALMMFYAADGTRYLHDKNDVNKLKEWSVFINEVYYKITNNEFLVGNIKFVPPLNKVQIFKLKKLIINDEEVFLEEFGINDWNISI